jgi:hypothetical protein
MHDDPDDTLSPTDTTTEIDILLEEAEAFKRGGSPLEALARARVALQVLDEQLVEHGDEEEAPTTEEAEELRARVLAAITHYQRLSEAWQRENVDRENAYLERERSILRDPGREP